MTFDHASQSYVAADGTRVAEEVTPAAYARRAREAAAVEARRLAREVRIAEAAREVAGRGEILEALSHSARAGVLAREARLANA